MIDLKAKKILVTGAHGFLGTHLVKNLIEKRGVPAVQISTPSAKECDLLIKENCDRAVAGMDIVIHLAAKVGGIGFNLEFPGELFYDNLMMGAQLIEAARKAKVEKMVNLGTICAYPKFAPTPFNENDIWDGYPEETNAPYGLAKKMLMVQSDAYRAQYGMNAVTLFPVNMYGPGDTFDPGKSHVIAALIKRIRDAKKSGQTFIEVWGDGTATREFMYIEDGAEGVLLATEKYDKPGAVNIGSGTEISIKDLVSLLAKLMDFEGEIRWDASKPNGQPRRILDVSKAQNEFGFTAQTPFEQGLRNTIAWYDNNNS